MTYNATTRKLYFTNPGEVDIRAVTTLGVNVKSGENTIGHFGTGLKYAIAGVLRLGGRVSIWSGISEYKFDSSLTSIRGKDFAIVNVDTPGISTALGFTTELGKDWEPWQIYRELRSNALDEGGDASLMDEVPVEGTTLVEVICEEILQAHYGRSEFWLQSTPLWAGHGVEVHEGATENLFYQGLRATAPDYSKTAAWAYSYSVTDKMELTEDRTFASFHDVRSKIAKALAQCDNEEIIDRVLGNEAEAKGFDFDHWEIQANQEFVQVVLDRIEKKLAVPASARALVRRSNEEELEEAELEIPSTWHEMERRAPEVAPEVKANYYDWKTEMEERMEALEKEAKYWKLCARKLGALARGK